jgi:hypothetical protein
MLGVTCFGLLFTPAFYTFIRKLGRKEQAGGVSVSAYSTYDREHVPISRGSVSAAGAGSSGSGSELHRLLGSG